MATKEVWDDKIHLVFGDVLYTHLYVSVDPTKMNGPTLETAFTFQADVRGAGIDLWSTGPVPLRNGAVVAKPTVAPATGLGTVQGEIDDWGFTGASWASATAINFLVVAKADLSVPIAALGGLLGALGGLFGSKVRITIGHANVSIPIVRDANGNITSINHTPVP